MSDTWPPLGPQQRESLLEHIGDVWTLRHIETNCTAAIWRNHFGLELRVENTGEFALEITRRKRVFQEVRNETRGALDFTDPFTRAIR